MHVVFQVWKGLFLVVAASYANLLACKCWCWSSGTVVRSRAALPLPQRAMKSKKKKGKGEGEQGLQQLSRSIWVRCWEQPGTDGVICEDYSYCREGEIRQEMKQNFQRTQKAQSEWLPVCWPLLPWHQFCCVLLRELFLKYNTSFLKCQLQFCRLCFQEGTAVLLHSWHFKWELFCTYVSQFPWYHSI